MIVSPVLGASKLTCFMNDAGNGCQILLRARTVCAMLSEPALDQTRDFLEVECLGVRDKKLGLCKQLQRDHAV
jgi:hypothetical protein